MTKIPAILAAAALAGLMASGAGAATKSKAESATSDRFDYNSPYAKALRAAARRECNNIGKYPDGAQAHINYKDGWFRCDWKSGRVKRNGMKNR